MLSPGSSIDVGPVAQGAAVPMLGLGLGFAALLAHGAAVDTPVLGVGELVGWVPHGACVPV